MNLYTAALLIGPSLLAGCASSPSEADITAKAEAQTTSVFSYDQAALTGAKPWTSESFNNNNPDNFQFAVIGDRTGGADPKGVFIRAMDQLNLLQPEFVINVGDLVEGYTEDRAQANAMWDEVEPMIQKLEMPFFFVGGNHDLGNDNMTQVWLDRHGATYYHFVYRNVLFLVLNSEDPSNPIPKDVGEKTVQYKKLQQEDPAAAHAMLAEFMGSLDAYKKPMVMSDQQINYFKKDGPGNVDHFLWISMKDDGPEIAKITLDGIYDRQGRSLQLKEMYERDAGTKKQ